MPRRSLPILQCPLLAMPSPPPMPGGVCSQCDQRVHDLERLSVAELEAVLARPGSVCVKGRVRGDGSLVLHPAAASASLTLMLATVTACTPLSGALALDLPDEEHCRDAAGFAVACNGWPRPPAPPTVDERAPPPTLDTPVPIGEIASRPAPRVPPEPDAPSEAGAAPPPCEPELWSALEPAPPACADGSSTHPGGRGDACTRVELGSTGGLFGMPKPAQCVADGPPSPGGASAPDFDALSRRLGEAAPPAPLRVPRIPDPQR